MRPRIQLNVRSSTQNCRVTLYGDGETPEVYLTHSELELLRYADSEGIYHEDIADLVGISRASVGRRLEVARKKLVDAIFNEQTIRVVEDAK